LQLRPQRRVGLRLERVRPERIQDEQAPVRYSYYGAPTKHT
jgi:hypothetical protein